VIFSLYFDVRLTLMTDSFIYIHVCHKQLFTNTEMGFLAILLAVCTTMCVRALKTVHEFRIEFSFVPSSTRMV